MKVNSKNTLFMLRESNAIENVWDRGSLITANKAFKYMMKFDELTVDVIKDTHSILMRGKDLFTTHNEHPIERKYIGDFRDVPVWIGYEKKSLPKIVIQSLVEDLCHYMNERVKANSPDKDEDYNEAIRFHLQFEAIHPFIDGNGRIGRIILNWYSIKNRNQLIVFTNERKHQDYYSLFR